MMTRSMWLNRPYTGRAGASRVTESFATPYQPVIPETTYLASKGQVVMTPSVAYPAGGWVVPAGGDPRVW